MWTLTSLAHPPDQWHCLPPTPTPARATLPGPIDLTRHLRMPSAPNSKINGPTADMTLVAAQGRPAAHADQLHLYQRQPRTERRVDRAVRPSSPVPADAGVSWDVSRRERLWRTGQLCDPRDRVPVDGTDIVITNCQASQQQFLPHLDRAPGAQYYVQGKHRTSPTWTGSPYRPPLPPPTCLQPAPASPCRRRATFSASTKGWFSSPGFRPSASRALLTGTNSVCRWRGARRPANPLPGSMDGFPRSHRPGTRSRTS